MQQFLNSTHNLRMHPHDPVLPNKPGHLSDCTSLTEMVFKAVYGHI